MRSRLLRLHVMLIVALATGLSPCLGDTAEAAPCPMAGCEKPATESLRACCCEASRSPADSSAGIVTPRPDKAPLAAIDFDAPGHETVSEAPDSRSPSLSPAPVPLYLLHATLLI